MNKKNWLVIANGKTLSKRQLQQLAVQKSIMVLDGAWMRVKDWPINVDIVLGDFDSIDQRELSRRHAANFIHTPDQSRSDLEKALLYLIPLKPDSVTLCQATGLRMDHTLFNLRLLKRFHQDFQSLYLVTETEKIYFLRDQHVRIQVAEKQPLALMAFPEAIINSVGLEYDMKDYPLTFAYQESISNAVVAQLADIDVKGEALLITSHASELKACV